MMALTLADLWHPPVCCEQCATHDNPSRACLEGMPNSCTVGAGPRMALELF